MTDHLFELIKSLNKNEKGYLRKCIISPTSSKQQNNNVFLFDALEKMKEYDEEKLLTQLKDHSFSKFLSRQKNYLYDLILKYIQSYYLKNDAEIKLNSYFSSIKLLYDKGLLSHCEKLLWKSKKIIDRHFLYAHQVQLNRWEYKIALAQLNIENIRESRRKHMESVDQLSKLLHYIELYGELYSLIIKTGNDIPKNRRKQFLDFSKNPLLTCSDKNLSLHSKHYYHRILTIFHETMMDYKKADFHSQKRLELFQRKPETIHINPEQYINTLNNRIDILLRLKKYGEAKVLCGILKNRQFTTLFLNARRMTKYYLGDFKTSIMTFDFNSIVSKTDEVSEFVLKNKMLVRSDEKIQIYFFISYALFAEGLYKQSLHRLNLILNSKDEIQEDFQVAARILNLVVHYELGNEDYLEHAVKSSLVYLKKKKRLLNAEKLFLDFIKKNILSADSEEEMNREFKRLKKNIQKKITPEENRAFSNFNFIYWIDSKIQKKTYSSILKKSACSVYPFFEAMSQVVEQLA